MPDAVRPVRAQAELVVQKLLAMKPGEHLATVVDAQTDAVMLQALGEVAAEAGVEVTVLTIPLRETARKNDLGRVVERALEGADALVGLTGGCGAPSHAEAVARLCAGKRLRYLSMVMRGVAHFTGGGALADWPTLSAEGERLAERWRKAKKLHVTTPAGTDLRAAVEGERTSVECGLADRPGARAAFPGGEISLLPKEGSADGRIVVDGPIAHLGAGDGFHLAVKAGKVLAVGGAGPRATALRKILGSVPNAANVAEVGVGLNPGCGRSGDVQEEKKARGLVHVALGDNVSLGGPVKCGVHLDMILYQPTVRLDGQVVVDDGRIVTLG